MWTIATVLRRHGDGLDMLADFITASRHSNGSQTWIVVVKIRLHCAWMERARCARLEAKGQVAITLVPYRPLRSGIVMLLMTGN